MIVSVLQCRGRSGWVGGGLQRQRWGGAAQRRTACTCSARPPAPRRPGPPARPRPRPPRCPLCRRGPQGPAPPRAAARRRAGRSGSGGGGAARQGAPPRSCCTLQVCRKKAGGGTGRQRLGAAGRSMDTAAALQQGSHGSPLQVQTLWVWRARAQRTGALAVRGRRLPVLAGAAAVLARHRRAVAQRLDVGRGAQVAQLLVQVALGVALGAGAGPAGKVGARAAAGERRHEAGGWGLAACPGWPSCGRLGRLLGLPRSPWAACRLLQAPQAPTCTRGAWRAAPWRTGGRWGGSRAAGAAPQVPGREQRRRGCTASTLEP